MKIAQDVILKPIVTERSMSATADKKYTFAVAKDATKIDIRHAVEELFKVKVSNVRTMNYDGKVKRQGATSGRRSSWKKAVVTLTPGSKTIEVFDSLS